MKRRSWKIKVLYTALGLLGLLVCAVLVFIALGWTAFGSAPDARSVVKIAASPQHKDGSFTNRLEEKIGPISTMLGRAINSQNTAPVRPPPVVSVQPGDFAGSAPGEINFTWFGHSTVLVELGDRRVLIDPVFSQRASPWQFMGPSRFHPPPMALDALPEIDAVLISHDHYDHLDHHSIRALVSRVGVFVVPLGVRSHLVYWGVPEEKVVELDWWSGHQLGELSFVSVPARHFSGRSAWDRNRTLWTGWAIIGPESRVFYSGDTAMFPGFREIGQKLGPFDLTIVETGAYDMTWADVHLGPEQAVQAHLDVRGRVMFGVHWGTFKLANHSWTEPIERLRIAANKAGVRLVHPRVGERVTVREAPQTRWWPEVPFQTAQEAPVVSSGLPSRE